MIKNIKLPHSGIAQSILIISYTIYSFLFAQNIDTIGNTFLLFLSFIAFYGVYNTFIPQYFINTFIKIFLFYFGFSLLTCVSEIWLFSDNNWTFLSGYKFLFCSLILSLFFSTKYSSLRFLRITTVSCCLVLSTFMIIQNTGLDLKHFISSFYIGVVNTNWNEKYHTFWLIFLSWSSLFLSSLVICINKKYLLIITILVYTSTAIYTSYSDSAKFAWIISIFVFLLSQVNAKVLFKYLSICIIFYILIFPFVWQIFPSSCWEWTNSINDRIFRRILLFETASNAIMDSLFLGHGFGSTLSLPIYSFLPELDLQNEALDWLAGVQHDGLFPGSHPHNIVALIWLDWGLIGALSISFFAYKFYKWLIPHIECHAKGSFIIGLLSTALVIFSFSFSIWQTDVVIIYAMFFVSLMIIIFNKHVEVSVKNVRIH